MVYTIEVIGEETKSMFGPHGPGREDTWDFGGYCVPVHLEKGKGPDHTRKGNDWTDRFLSIAAAARYSSG